MACERTYVFAVEVEQEDDGRWSAVIPDLPGCSAWGHSRGDALHALEENARDYLHTLEEMGHSPEPWKETRVLEGPSLAICA